MYCAKCNNHLSQCTCPDLKERIEKLKQSKHLFIAPDTLKTYEDQAERNQNEQSRCE